MATDTKSNGSEQRPVRQEQRLDVTAPIQRLTAAADYQEQPGQARSFGLGDSMVVVWPHFNIGTDGRAYV